MIMAADKTRVHTVPGEFTHDGMVFTARTTPELLDNVKQYNMDGQVAVVGYPKTGEST